MTVAWKLTDPFHRAPYPAIAPSRPELTQAGKTILVTGGNAGIGYAIAKAFAQASAANVIILGRSAERTKDAAAQLASVNPHTKITGLTCDVSSAEAVTELWGTLDKDQIVVDVLVLNAVKISAQKPLLEAGTDDIWKDFDMNVRAQLQMTERFYKQPGQRVSGPKVRNYTYFHLTLPHFICAWLQT
jgi:NAD(P)-dependent dehydrogenase (short-subunit alcohol dehydrogenase family)